MQPQNQKTVNVNIRVNPQVKKEAEAVLNETGLNLNDVFNNLLNQIRLTHSIPFPLYGKEINTVKTKSKKF